MYPWYEYDDLNEKEFEEIEDLSRKKKDKLREEKERKRDRKDKNFRKKIRWLKDHKDKGNFIKDTEN